MSTADLSNLPNARKLVAAAEAAGLKVSTGADDTFTRVAVASKDGATVIVAEWWTSLREFNYATVKDVPSRKSRRADSLKQARKAVGI